MRYTIGQFAGLHLVSKKTLRYYKDIGLLEPAGIDSVNGYAFYEDEQCERMRHIQYLRRLRFSLDEIRMLLSTEPKSWIDPVQARLAVVRSEGRLLRGIEHELLALQNRIHEGRELYKPMAIKTEYEVNTFELKDPIFITGRAARVPYNKYEGKQVIIENLISNFYGNDEPSMIKNQAIPAASFGLVCECEEDMSTGTYLMGIQVTGLDEVPEGMRSFTLPAGVYARVNFQASDRETLTGSALEGAYDHLYNKWLPNSEYIIPEMLAAEVYIEDRMEMPVNPEMQLWQLVKHK